MYESKVQKIRNKYNIEVRYDRVMVGGLSYSDEIREVEYLFVLGDIAFAGSCYVLPDMYLGCSVEDYIIKDIAIILHDYVDFKSEGGSDHLEYNEAVEIERVFGELYEGCMELFGEYFVQDMVALGGEFKKM